MKVLDFKIDKYQIERILLPMRSKEDVILLWMRTIKTIICYVEPTDESTSGLIRLHIDKMSRLFIFTESIAFSINFPFVVRIDGDTISFSLSSCNDIDSKITSEIIGLISTHKVLDSHQILDFVDPFLCSCDHYSIFAVFKDLLVCEDGYIRFDHDITHENGDNHPLNHLDIFYSSAATFKIGLRERLSIHDFADILDTGTDCHYLYKSSTLS